MDPACPGCGKADVVWPLSGGEWACDRCAIGFDSRTGETS